MSEPQNLDHLEMTEEEKADSMSDAMAATGIIALVVCTVAFWLSGMPT